jgi:hypothetical protein
MKRTIDILITSTLIFTTLLIASAMVSRKVICSQLVYKKEFVRVLFYFDPNKKAKPEYLLGIELEIAKYNAWLTKMQYLREQQGMRLFIPEEIMDEEEFNQ